MMNELKSTAYHEAGHAVMAWFCENELGTITIKPEGMNAGGIKHRDYAPFPSLVDGHFLNNQELELVDGTIRKPIELQFNAFVSGTFDHFTVNEKAVLIAAAGEVAQKKFSPESFHPYQTAQDWADVFKALEHTDGGARERLYNATEGILDDPLVWAAVNAVADELLARETLSSSDAIAAMRRAIKHHLNQS